MCTEMDFVPLTSMPQKNKQKKHGYYRDMYILPPPPHLPYQHGFHTKGLVNPIAKNSVNKYVVIQFYSWFAFSSLLVEIYYDNHTLPITQEQRKIKCKPRIKLNHIILHVQIVYWRLLNRNSSRNLK